METVTAEARLRRRNQLTLPDPIVRASGLEEGERFVVEVAADDPDTVVLRRLRASYAGALRGIYSDTGRYLETERESWDE